MKNKMNKKAFTLIELLAVIVLLSIIAVIAIVAVRKNIANTRNTLYDLQIKNIEDGAKNWVIDNIDKIPIDEPTYVTLGKLKKEGYVDDPITSPQNDKLCFPNGLRVEIISHQSGKYDYKVLDEEIEYVDCSEQSTHLFSTIAIEDTNTKYTTIEISYRIDAVESEAPEDFDIECLYGLTEDKITNSNNITVDKENKTCTIANLNSDTKYYFTLFMETDDKISNSVTSNATTKNGPKIVAGNINTTDETITIPYTISNLGEHSESDFNVRCLYGRTEKNITSTENVIVDTTSKTCTITGLSSKTKYYYNLILENEDEIISVDTGDATTSKIFGGTLVGTGNVCDVVYMNPVNLYEKCNASNAKSTTGLKSGCMKFYIYDGEGDTYDLILDHNTTDSVKAESSSEGIWVSYDSTLTQSCLEFYGYDNNCYGESITCNTSSPSSGNDKARTQITKDTSTWNTSYMTIGNRIDSSSYTTIKNNGCGSGTYWISGAGDYVSSGSLKTVSFASGESPCYMGHATSFPTAGARPTVTIQKSLLDS